MRIGKQTKAIAVIAFVLIVNRWAHAQVTPPPVGTAYVANWGSGTVQQCTPAGAVSTLASGLTNPWGMTMSPGGDLFVCNGDNTVVKITTSGVKSIFASGFNFPYDAEFDHHGNLYVSNYGNGTITKFDTQGVRSTFASFPGISLYGMTIDPADNVYVGTSDDVNIKKITPGGIVTNVSWTRAGTTATDMAFDTSGNLFVANYYNIMKVAPNGATTTFATIGGGDNNFMAFDRNGNLFMTNQSLGRVSEISPAGVVSTFAMTGSTTPNGIVVVVPEPRSALMIGISLAALLLRRGRSSNQFGTCIGIRYGVSRSITDHVSF